MNRASFQKNSKLNCVSFESDYYLRVYAIDKVNNTLSSFALVKLNFVFN